MEEYTCLEGLVDTPLPLAEGMYAYEEPSITETVDDGLPLWARPLVGSALVAQGSLTAVRAREPQTIEVWW